MRTIITFLLIPLAVFSQQTGVAFFEGTWGELLQKAATEKKPVFVDCYTDWCGPCKWMTKNVFPNDTAGAFYNARFINYKLDMEKGEGPEVAKQYAVKAYPTLLYVDAGGKTLHKSVGRLNVEEFIAEGAIALDPSQQLEHLSALYEKGERGSDFITRYADRLYKAGDREKAGEIVNHYLAAVPEQQLAEKKNWDLIKQYVREYDNNIYQYVWKNRSIFKEAYPDDVDGFLNMGATRSLRVAGKQHDEKKLAELLDVLLQTKTPEASADRTELWARRQFYEAAKQWDKYAELTEVYVQKEYYKMILSHTPETDTMLKKMNKTYEQYITENSANMLNNDAWTFYEQVDDTALLAKAEQWAKLSVQLHESYYNLDTYAALLLKQGKKKEGKAMAKKAIAKAKESGIGYNSTEELLKKYK